jgi:hypothetical protein
VAFEDVTSTPERRRRLDHLPVERPYPLPETAVERISATIERLRRVRTDSLSSAGWPAPCAVHAEAHDRVGR